MMHLQERITKILLDDFKVPAESLGPDTAFGDLGFDSLVIVELSLVLDTEFGVALADGDLTDSMTVTDAAELLLRMGVPS